MARSYTASKVNQKWPQKQKANFVTICKPKHRERNVWLYPLECKEASFNNKINTISIQVQWQIYYSLLPHLLFTHKIHHEGSRDAPICQACDFVKQHQTTAPWTRVCSSHTIPPLLFKVFHVLVCAVKSDGETCASVNRSWPGRSCCVGCCSLSLAFSLNPVYAGAVNSSRHTNQRSCSDIKITRADSLCATQNLMHNIM